MKRLVKEARSIVEELGIQAKKLKKEASADSEDAPESKLLRTKLKRGVKVLQQLGVVQDS
jgi:hypothetical protein